MLILPVRALVPGEQVALVAVRAVRATFAFRITGLYFFKNISEISFPRFIL